MADEAKGEGGLRSALLRGLVAVLLRLPYRWRVPLCGLVMARVIAPLAGYDARVRQNLALAMPGLPAAEVRRLVRKVPENLGRTLIELFSGAEFAARVVAGGIAGPGLAVLDRAHAEGRPVILVTGHFGNYDASRAALIARGFRVGGLYQPMRDAAFNARYVQAIAEIGTPLFPRGRAGLGDMVRFLKSGGMLGMVIDQAMAHGTPLGFFGLTANTALSAAELALKYDAALVPTYGIRRADGLTFDVVVEAPIPPGTPEAMTQALNDSLEALVRRHMDQWFWIHRRWKGAGRPV